MSSVAPGWYKDPAEPTTQRYWDGEGWIGEPIPADAPAPDGPPATEALATQPPPAPPAVQAPTIVPTPAATPPNQTAPPNQTVAPGAPAPPGVPGPPTMPPAGYHPAPGVPYPYLPGYPMYVSKPPAPEPHGFPVASLGKRLAARLIDFGLVLALNVVVTGWFAVQWWTEAGPYYREAGRRLLANESASDLVAPERASDLLLVIVILIAALWFAYEVPTTANTGQTPGKRLMGIRVMRLESDAPLGFGRSIRRWNLFGLSTLLWTCYVGFIIQFVVSLSPVWNWPLHMGLHDRSAGTVVVQVGQSTTGGTPSTDADHQRTDADQPARTEEDAR